MAKIDVIMPQMGESIAEGTLSRWIKQVGDTVKRDEPIFEISTDKVDAEIPSPTAGVLAEILVTEGQTVAVQTVVARIETEAGAAAAPAAAAPKAPAPERAPAPSAPSAPAAAPAAAAAPASVSIRATTVCTATVCPSWTRISASTPAVGAGISASTLSVEISKIGSSRFTSSPTFFHHFDSVPSAMDSPIWGMMTSIFAIPVSLRSVTRSGGQSVEQLDHRLTDGPTDRLIRR